MEITKSMANYANKFFEEYVPEDSFKEAMLYQNSVPDNLDNVKNRGRQISFKAPDFSGA